MLNFRVQDKDKKKPLSVETSMNATLKGSVENAKLEVVLAVEIYESVKKDIKSGKKKPKRTKSSLEELMNIELSDAELEALLVDEELGLDLPEVTEMIKKKRVD